MQKNLRTRIGKVILFSMVIGGLIGGNLFAQEGKEKTDAKGKDVPYTSSIQIKEKSGEKNESVALRGKAKIDISDAEKTALTAFPGTKVVESKLENENGNLVYSVTLDNSKSLKIDAGNAVVLQTENAMAEKKGDKEVKDSGSGKDKEESSSEE
jgi:uncharacterized membrane protein YkoI